MEAFRKNQQQFQEAMQGAFASGPFAELAKRNMKMLEVATSAFAAPGASAKKEEGTSDHKDDEIALLKAQLAALTDKIDKLS